MLLALFKLVPSYWLVLAGRSALTGSSGSPWQAWTVTAGWTAVLAGLAAWVYRRDTLAPEPGLGKLGFMGAVDSQGRASGRPIAGSPSQLCGEAAAGPPLTIGPPSSSVRRAGWRRVVFPGIFACT